MVGYGVLTPDLDLYEIYYDKGQENQYSPNAKQPIILSWDELFLILFSNQSTNICIPQSVIAYRFSDTMLICSRKDITLDMAAAIEAVTRYNI